MAHIAQIPERHPQSLPAPLPENHCGHCYVQKFEISYIFKWHVLQLAYYFNGAFLKYGIKRNAHCPGFLLRLLPPSGDSHGRSGETRQNQAAARNLLRLAMLAKQILDSSLSVGTLHAKLVGRVTYHSTREKRGSLHAHFFMASS